VESVQHAGGVLELVIDHVLAALERVQSCDLHPPRKTSPRSFSQLRWALPDRPGTRSRSLAVGCELRVSSTTTGP
jgi:hypothetical protein